MPSDKIKSNAPRKGVTLNRRVVVALDEGVFQPDLLSRELPERAEVILLPTDQDGIAWLAEKAQSLAPVDALHILAHGGPGMLKLGTVTFNMSSLTSTHRDAFESIRQALSPRAEILIYGCRFGADQAGSAMLHYLAELTGLPIAAASAPIGAAALGGTWTLDVRTAPLQSTPLYLPRWQGLMNR